MRILVTGASGLIGSAMVERLAQSHEILTLGRRASADFRADLSDPAAIAALELPAIDALVHCAGVVDEDFRDHPERAMQMAMFGADALVQKAVAAGATRLVYISSAHVYGPMVGHVDETTAYNPVSNYAIAHFATEQVFRRQAKGAVAGAALRPCAVFGDLADPSGFRRWSLIPFSFPRDAAIEHRIVIRSTGEQRRNFVGMLRQLAGQRARRLERPEPAGHADRNRLRFRADLRRGLRDAHRHPLRDHPGHARGPDPGRRFRLCHRLAAGAGQPGPAPGAGTADVPRA